MEKQNNKYSFINYLKAFAIILVIFQHSISFYIQNISSNSKLLTTLLRFVYAVHVPLFFGVAGFLCHKQDILCYYQKKIKRLIIPFITFSILKLLYSNIISDSFQHSNTITSQLVDAFLYGRLYWFIYCMLIIYIFSPVLWLHKIIPFIVLPILIILNVTNEKYGIYRADDLTIFQIGRVPSNLVYFVSGFILNRFEIRTGKKCSLRMLLISTILITILFFLNYNDLLPYNYCISLVLTYTLFCFLISISLLMPYNIDFLVNFSKYSLQCMFLDSFYKVVFYFILLKISKNCMIIFLVSILDCVFSLYTSIFMDKMPKKIKFIFGL